MPKAKVYTMTGEVVGELELGEAVFGIEPSKAAMHTVVKAHLAARRQGTQSTLTRAEVSGGGIKPWRQKGTGRARHGSTRGPQWMHGGIALGPKPRKYRVSINKKVRRLAMRSALSAKAAAGELLVVDNIDMAAIKTKDFAAFLQKIGANKPLIVTPQVRENIIKSARNIPGVCTTVAGVLSVYEILKHNTFIVDKAAVAMIEEVYGA